MQRADSLEKTLMLGKIKGRRRRGQQMVGRYHQLNGHNKFEQTREIVKDEGAGVLWFVRSQGIAHDLGIE